MNIGLYIAILVILTGLFTALVICLQAKNPISWVDDYPTDIKQAYYRHIGQEEKAKTITKGTIIRKTIASLVFVFLFAFLIKKVGAESFISGFVLSLICWVWIGIYDTVFLDFVVFANWKKLRLPGTEDMDKEYHQKKFHVVEALKHGLLIAVVVSLLTGVVVMVL